MRKNFIFVFALMFALIALLSVNVMAGTTNYSAFYGAQVSPSHGAAQSLPTALRLVTNVNVTYRINITFSLDVHEATTGVDSILQGGNITQIKITLPTGLRYNANGTYGSNKSRSTVINTTMSDRMLSNFTASGQTLLWQSTLVNGTGTSGFADGGGLNLSGFRSRGLGSCSDNTTLFNNVSLLFDVEAYENNADATFTVEFIYGNNTVWNSTTLAVPLYDRVNMTNSSPLRFNEDVALGTLINITVNFTGDVNHPFVANTSISGYSINGVNFTVSSSTMGFTQGSDNGNTSTLMDQARISAGNITYRWNTTVFGWGNYSNNNHEYASLINASSVAGAVGSFASFAVKINASQPGNYTLTVMTRDNASVTNQTIFTITIADVTAPSNISFVCSPLSMYQGEIVKCTCTFDDNYYTSGTNTGGACTSCTSIITPPVSSAISGTISELCSITDGNSNSASATASYTVNAAGGSSPSAGSSGPGTGYPGGTTHNVNTLGTTAKTMTSGAEENLKFTTTTGTTSGTTFVGTVDTVTDTGATLTIVDLSGANKAVAIDVGGESKVDLDADGTYDLSITLSSVTNGKALFAMKEISETVPASVSGEEETEEAAAEKAAAEAATKNLTWLYIVGGIVVIIIIIIILTQKKSPVGVFFLTLFSKNGAQASKRK